MRFTRSSILAALVAVSLISGSASAQHRTHRWETGPSRFSLVGDLLVAQPKGEFATQIDTQGFGGNVGGLFRLDKEGVFSVRADIGGMQYGSETLRVPYLPVTGRVALDVNTTNDVFWGSIGPQITAPVGPIPALHQCGNRRHGLYDADFGERLRQRLRIRQYHQQG